jgi:uncharacterized Zn finger protein
MVSYGHYLTVVHRPPHICPKCGSHRTQVVGLADEGQTVVVRCNACGERSEIKIGPETTVAASDSGFPLSL